jgi:hypothetical protein
LLQFGFDNFKRCNRETRNQLDSVDNCALAHLVETRVPLIPNGICKSRFPRRSVVVKSVPLQAPLDQEQLGACGVTPSADFTSNVAKLSQPSHPSKFESRARPFSLFWIDIQFCGRALQQLLITYYITRAERRAASKEGQTGCNNRFKHSHDNTRANSVGMRPGCAICWKQRFPRSLVAVAGDGGPRLLDGNAGAWG